MTKTISFLIFLTLCTFLCAENSIIRVRVPQSGNSDNSVGVASGVVIRNENNVVTVLTSAHQFERSREAQIEIILDNGYVSIPATISKINKDSDLTVLTFNALSFKFTPIPVAEKMPEIGSQCKSSGFVATKKINTNIKIKSYDSYFQGSKKRHMLVMVDKDLKQGNSGGPLIYEDQVIGILSTSSGKGYSFFVHLDDIQEILK